MSSEDVTSLHLKKEWKSHDAKKVARGEGDLETLNGGVPRPTMASFGEKATGRATCQGFPDLIERMDIKVQKNGTHEHVPPPRPKRKATHPYPQKASKNAHIVSQPTIPFQTSSCLIEPGYTVRSDSSLVLRNSSSSGTRDTWAHGSTQPVIPAHMIKEDIRSAGAIMVNTCCRSSTESPSKTWKNFETADQGHNSPSLRDFAQVYSFIGTVFDPSTSGHLQKLKQMDPIDVETEFIFNRRNLEITNLFASYCRPHDDAAPSRRCASIYSTAEIPVACYSKAAEIPVAYSFSKAACAPSPQRYELRLLPIRLYGFHPGDSQKSLSHTP
ncbi:Transcription factor ASG4 [Platanthera guangdongensis]|uniref:Transcription factor ASG4 n=1 Tax=Platanthera guangdongensis TaxID=2320717 RepID=A0ABR2MM95_9ASPA